MTLRPWFSRLLSNGRHDRRPIFRPAPLTDAEVERNLSPTLSKRRRRFKWSSES